MNIHNSVQPKYSTLREELTMNEHATISEAEYKRLRRICSKLKRNYIAKDIGIMNEVCGIKPGSEMTVEHMICLKVYTDFTDQQATFKEQCRSLYRDEPIEKIIRRNREIAHWCRLLRESIMFFGETMTESDTVYCGLNAKLIFSSLHQIFECPLSTTLNKTVAMGFAEETQGIILTLKRSSPKTRFFNMASISAFDHEDERLFSGSDLKIVDISIGLHSLKKYINALRMLEQIANGYFIDFGGQTGALLLSLLRRWVAIEHILQRLSEEQYDTDGILNDIDLENVNDSNVIIALEKEQEDWGLKLVKDITGKYLSFRVVFQNHLENSLFVKTIFFFFVF